MGCARAAIDAKSELAMTDTLHDVKVLTVPSDVIEGSMLFVKRSAGDEISISFNSQHPKAGKDYHVILTDALPAYEADWIIGGDINAITNNGASTLSAMISYRTESSR